MPARSSQLQLATIFLGWMSALACTPATKQQNYQVSVLVESDPGVPLAGIEIRTGNRSLGKTDASGLAHLSLVGAEGDKIPLTVTCPPFHREPEGLAARLVTFARGKAPVLRAVCLPDTRHLAVVVRAQRGAFLPVVHRSRQVGVTDGDGVAHVLLEGAPGDSIQLTLDTSARPDLKPQNPVVSFAIDSTDSVVSYDTEFTEAVKARKSVRKIVPRGPKRIR